MSPATPLSAQTLVVTSTTGTFSSNVTIDKSGPPGLFSLFGTGTHDGAILNAVTFALGAFSVTTGKGPTFLAIFATGLDLSTAPTVTVGGVPVTVQFFGNAPCCMGLEQINVLLPASLSGAGRVEVVLQSGTQMSNAVEIVLLPKQGEGPFADDQDNQTRSRELAAIASVPGTSLALVTDENDDVVRVADISQRKITHTIALPDDAEPVAVAVNATGSLAVVAERGLGQVAIIDLTTFMVTAEVKTGLGPVSVAIAGNNAVVVNGDADTVTVVDLVAKTALKTLSVGRGPRAAADAGTMKAFVTNEDAGTVSVIDLVALTVSDTITLGANVRPAAIQLIPGSNLAVITVPSAGNNGQALLLNLTTRAFTPINVNPDRSGGSSDVAVNGTTVYFANQTGASVSFVPISLATGLPSAPPASIKVDLGARALAIDTKDNLLLVTNEGSGTIVLVDLVTGKVVDRINGVRSEMEGDDGGDDHSDHDRSANLPVIASLTPLTAKTTSTFTLTITGSKLTGATDVIFVNPADVHGRGKGKGDSPISARDSAFAASNIQVNAGGTQLTATIKATAAVLGPRVVIVLTPNGASMFAVSITDTLTVIP
jgi:YVTN family beta-propeller protein